MRMASMRSDASNSCKHNTKKDTTTVRGLSCESTTDILTEEKDKQATTGKPTHVTVYLLQDLNRDSCRQMLKMMVGPSVSTDSKTRKKKTKDAPTVEY